MLHWMTVVDTSQQPAVRGLCSIWPARENGSCSGMSYKSRASCAKVAWPGGTILWYFPALHKEETMRYITLKILRVPIHVACLLIFLRDVLILLTLTFADTLSQKILWTLAKMWQPCSCKVNHVSAKSQLTLLYQISITVFTSKTKCLLLIQNLMGFLLQFTEIRFYIQN